MKTKQNKKTQNQCEEMYLKNKTKKRNILEVNAIEEKKK